MAYGYSSLEWDQTSGELYGYTETDLDFAAMLYYRAQLNAFIMDLNDNILANALATDVNNPPVGYVSATMSTFGKSAFTYTLYSHHTGDAIYSNRACTSYSPRGSCTGYTVYYDDYWDYSSFSDDGAPDTYPDDGMWFGPGPQTEVTTPTPPIGETTDQLTLYTQGPCGDERDQMIEEYYTYQTGLRAYCDDFTSSGHSQYFSFAELNYPSPKTAPAKYPFAILTYDALTFFDQWYSNTPFPAINSGYRCPSQNALAGGVHNSQHMFGTAIDAQNATGNTAGWNNLFTGARKAHADYIEPQTGPCKLACVHGDVRMHTASYVYP